MTGGKMSEQNASIASPLAGIIITLTLAVALYTDLRVLGMVCVVVLASMAVAQSYLSLQKELAGDTPRESKP